MGKISRSESGISATVSIFLLVILVIGIAIVLWSVFMGYPSILHHTVYIASEAKAEEFMQPGGIPMEIVTLRIKEAEPFHFSGQEPPVAGKEVVIKVVTPDGRTLYPVPFIKGGSLEGKTLYIYPNSTGFSSYCDYVVSDMPPTGRLKPFTTGTWLIQLIDPEANLLVSSDDRARITKGASSYAVAGGTPGSGVYRTDCTPLSFSVHGNPVRGNTGPPMNMSYLSFDGNDWLEFADDPTLTFTGALTISMWLKPQDVGTPSQYTNSQYWKQVIGKGLQISSNKEDKNYDLYLIGDRIYFEWDDRVTGTHYHIMTDSTAVYGNTWQYVNLVVEGGKPKIYVNGVSRPFSYYQSNVPGNNKITNPALYPEVRLKDNNHPMTMGKQASSVYPFYYKGEIGSFALYNRGLTEQEILENYQSYGV
ncbi:MAG: LamG domain-containing protein [Methanolinea sp.]|nr:LamG domain-containing protein [Methanolinea sp.]